MMMMMMMMMLMLMLMMLMSDRGCAVCSTSIGYPGKGPKRWMTKPMLHEFPTLALRFVKLVKPV